MKLVLIGDRWVRADIVQSVDVLKITTRHIDHADTEVWRTVVFFFGQQTGVELGRWSSKADAIAAADSFAAKVNA